MISKDLIKKRLFVLLLFPMVAFSQSKEMNSTTSKNTKKVWRINFLNPAVELEVPTSKNTTFSVGLGIGYGFSYEYSSNWGSNFLYFIAPVLDLQYKLFYNFDNRKRKNLTIDNNSGNFVSARLVTTGNTIWSNIYRHSNYDFAVGPTWGIQRKYGKRFHLLFDLGPVYYFNTTGRGDISLVTFRLNLGFDL